MAIAPSMAKNAPWLMSLHKVPTNPAARLPLKIARNQAATVVAPIVGGAKPGEQPETGR